MGTKQQNVIEINGKRYDAVTGKMLSDSTTTADHNQPLPATAPRKGQVLDGFVRSKARPHNHTHKKTQKSQTLARAAVKKPNAVTEKTETKIEKSHLGHSVQRQVKAQTTPKNPFISKYGHSVERTTVRKSIQHMPVKAASPATTQRHAVHRTATEQSIGTTAAVRNNGTHTAKPGRSLAEHALTNARAHEEPVHTPHKRSRKKLAHRLGISAKALALSSTVLSAVLLAGFFAVQNVPNLAMRVAATRSGFDATMPGFSPSGFSFKGPIHYSTGQVVIHFKSNTDNRSYSVTEKSSNWNSDALLANFVMKENSQYQTYLDRGRTLYIYNGSNATWVDNGIWYQIEGDSDLTTDQLVRIAASI